MVPITGNGVDGFTPDKGIGGFLLAQPDNTLPTDTREFAFDTSNMRFREPPVRRCVHEALVGTTGPREADFNLRWTASMVAEVHRILTRGGIFLYPPDDKMNSKGIEGQLRPRYEANPMRFIGEPGGLGFA